MANTKKVLNCLHNKPKSLKEDGDISWGPGALLACMEKSAALTSFSVTS